MTNQSKKTWQPGPAFLAARAQYDEFWIWFAEEQRRNRAQFEARDAILKSEGR